MACCAASTRRALKRRAASLLAMSLLLASAPAMASGAPYTVYAAGDIAYCDKTTPALSGAAATADLVEAALTAEPRAAVLVLGDNVYQRGTAREYADCYAPTWGRFKARTYPAPGNREYATRGASGYFSYFGSASYYGVQLGAWRVLSLDSNLKGPAQQAQLAWLEQELARSTERCTLAYWHHPLYSSGGHGSIGVMRAAWELLHRAGAEIVLSGHDHDYERFAPQDANGALDRDHGVRQFVVGTGGAFPTPFLWPLKHSEMRDNSRIGVLKLVLADDGYEWEFLEAQYHGFPYGQQADRGKGQCH
jgi:3',5'-cyclic AMP phosphodiesterase CpdA